MAFSLFFCAGIFHPDRTQLNRWADGVILTAGVGGVYTLATRAGRTVKHQFFQLVLVRYGAPLLPLQAAQLPWRFEVWMRPPASVVGMRCTRCTPLFKLELGVSSPAFHHENNLF